MSLRTDANGNATSYEYDVMGRVTRQTDALGGVTEFAYNTTGTLASLKDAEGNTTAFTYDSYGRKVRETRPMGEYAVFAYDTYGRLATKTDAKGQVTTYHYDNLSRPTGVGYADGKTETFGYDTKGRLSTYDGEVSGELTYDRYGRKLSETVDYGAFSKSYSYAFDTHGRKASYTAPDGAAYGYTYTNLGQLETVTLPGGSVGYTYDFDRLAGRTVPGVSTSYSYNANGWLAGIDAGAVMDYTYGFDNVGNITSKATEHGTYSYSYDKLYRLTGSDNPALADESFGYDKVGNRLASADAANWSYNANNELVNYDGVNYAYDQNGNTVSKSVSGQVTAFAYDAKDRMEQVNLPDGRIASYKYDPFGRRVSKAVDGVTTYFLYSQEGLVGEYDASGGLKKNYGWMPDGTWGTDPVFAVENGDVYYYYHNDHLGTPWKMTDGAGAVVWSAVYDAYGKAGISADSFVDNNFRFPGQYYDEETGLHYNFHRYYDPETGRYISADPIGLKAGLNLYLYASASPWNYSDPLGLLQEGQGIADIITKITSVVSMLFNSVNFIIALKHGTFGYIAAVIGMLLDEASFFTPDICGGNGPGAVIGLLDMFVTGLAAGSATVAGAGVLTISSTIVTSFAGGYAIGTWMYGTGMFDALYAYDYYTNKIQNYTANKLNDIANDPFKLLFIAPPMSGAEFVYDAGKAAVTAGSNRW